MPQMSSNGNRIITEHEKDEFHPYQPGNEAHVEHSLPETSFAPYGLFDKKIKNV